MADTYKQKENQSAIKKYQRKKEKNKFEDVVKHRIHKYELTKSPEENQKRYLKETTSQIKALYNHYGLEFDPILNGHELAICLAKEFIPKFLSENYHLGRPKKDTFFKPFAICCAFEILRIEGHYERASITSFAKEAQKRWNLMENADSLRVRYEEIKKTSIYSIFQKCFPINKLKEEQLTYLNDLLNSCLKAIEHKSTVQK